jgi:hypothetical protein
MRSTLRPTVRPSPICHTRTSTKCAKGQPGSHDEAKELFAGFAGAFVDREAETRGLDFIDRERAKKDAVDQSADQLQQQGGW